MANKTRYNYSPDDDSEMASTLKSAKLAEDFYGYSHPNRFTGHFDDDGEYQGKGKGGYGGYNSYSHGGHGYGNYGYRGHNDKYYDGHHS